MLVAIDGKEAGVIAVADVIKPSSKQAIEVLHKMGIEVAMITGDNKRTADAIAGQVELTGFWQKCFRRIRQMKC